MMDWSWLFFSLWFFVGSWFFNHFGLFRWLAGCGLFYFHIQWFGNLQLLSQLLLFTTELLIELKKRSQLSELNCCLFANRTCSCCFFRSVVS